MFFILSILVIVGLMVALGLVLIVAERYLVNYGDCKIDINSGERTLEIQGGQTLLTNLYESQIFIPSACGGKGTCGFCKVTVLNGGGQVLPTETPYLTRKEIRSGVRLACQVKVRQNIDLRIPDELLNVKLFRASVASTRELAREIKEIRFSLIDPPEINQRPGQYVQVQAPGPDGPVFRAYSISSAAYEKNQVELIVRLVPGGIGSTYLHNLEVGDEVAFTGPYGEFVLNEDPETEIICVGGGCGMAPMKNIIHTLYNRWPDRSCWLFFGARSAADVFYMHEFQELSKRHPNFHVVYALSDPLEDQQWSGETGFIHLAADKHLHGQTPRQAFLCGPEPMIQAVTAVLEGKGLPPETIFYDKF